MGLKGYTVAVSDIDAASNFLRTFLAAEVLYQAPREAVAARAVGFQVADAVVELITPSMTVDFSSTFTGSVTVSAQPSFKSATLNRRGNTSPSGASTLSPAPLQTPLPCPPKPT